MPRSVIRNVTAALLVSVTERIRSSDSGRRVGRSLRQAVGLFHSADGGMELDLGQLGALAKDRFVCRGRQIQVRRRILPALAATLKR